MSADDKLGLRTGYETINTVRISFLGAMGTVTVEEGNPGGVCRGFVMLTGEQVKELDRGWVHNAEND